MSDWDDVERRKQFHRRRWLALLVWCISFTIITFVTLVYLLHHVSTDKPCAAALNLIGGNLG